MDIDKLILKLEALAQEYDDDPSGWGLKLPIGDEKMNGLIKQAIQEWLEEEHSTAPQP